MTAWDTDLGRWRQQWWDYLRGGPVVQSAPTCVIRDPEGNPCTREAGHANAHDSGSYVFRIDPGEMWGPQGGAIPIPSPEPADEAFAREIALAHSAVDPVPAEPPTVWVDDVRDYGSDWDRVVGVVMRDREPNPAMVVIQTKPRDPVEGEVCDDEIEADAAVGVMPPAALVYAEPGGTA